MKFSLVILAIVGCALAEHPYPGAKSEGALLLLPPQYSQQSNKGPSAQINEAEDLSKVSDSVMSRLQQEEGSDSGSYHVYLNDGRLQKVQYTTAPVKTGDQQKSFQQQQFGQYNQGEGTSARVQQQQQYFQASSQPFSQQQKTLESDQPHPVVQQFSRLQQQLQAQQIQRLTDKIQELEQEQRRLQEQQEQLKSASYVASLRFSNVEPIKPPIYSYKSEGLTRVLRYAPTYY